MHVIIITPYPCWYKMYGSAQIVQKHDIFNHCNGCMWHTSDRGAKLLIYKVEWHLICFEVNIMLKGMFKVKLALLFVFKRLHFALPAYLDTFWCLPSFLRQFICPPHKKSGHPWSRLLVKKKRQAPWKISYSGIALKRITIWIKFKLLTHLSGNLNKGPAQMSCRIHVT